MSFFLQNFGVLAFTRNVTPYRPDTIWTDNISFEVAGGTVFTSRAIFLVVIVKLVLVIALTPLYLRTRLGKAMRATSQDPEVAQMMGVNVNRVIATTFLLGSMLAAAAGVLWGMSYQVLSQPAILAFCPASRRLPPPLSAASAACREPSSVDLF